MQGHYNPEHKQKIPSFRSNKTILSIYCQVNQFYQFIVPTYVLNSDNSQFYRLQFLYKCLVVIVLVITHNYYIPSISIQRHDGDIDKESKFTKPAHVPTHQNSKKLISNPAARWRSHIFGRGAAKLSTKGQCVMPAPPTPYNT